ncbi:MAG: hypothetical protein U0R80_05865 [Nocardioidaceae bacterium]
MAASPPRRRTLVSLGSAFGVGLASVSLLGTPAVADPAVVPGPVSVVATGAYSGTVPSGCAP